MSLIAHYRLDGNADDALGQFDATASNVTWVDGKLGQAGSFTTSYMSISNHPVRETGEFSLAFWVSPRSTTTACFFCARTVLGYGLSVFYINGGIRFDFGNQWTTSVSLDTNQWNHIVLTRSGNTKSLYKNGVFQGSTTFGDVTNFNPALATIGCSQVNGSSYDNFLDGLLDDYRIYDHALSKHEVRDLAKGLVFHLEATESGPKDKSLQGNTVVNNGATYVESVPVGKGGYEFNGTAFVGITDIPSDFKESITVCAWVKYSSYVGSKGAQPYSVITCKGQPFTWLLENPDNRFRWRAKVGTTEIYLNASTTHELNKHYLVVGTYDGAMMRLYIDGELNVETPASGNLAVNSISGKIGTYTGSTYNMDGVVSDVRIYTTALTADDIKDLYQRRASLDAQGNFYASLFSEVQLSNRISQAGEVAFDGFSEIGITDGLVAYYPLTKDAKDYSGNGNHGTVSGAVPVGGGFDGKGATYFNSPTTYIDLPNSLGYTTQVSAFAWFKSVGTPGDAHHIIMGGADLEISINTAGYLRTGVITDTRYVSDHGSGLLDGNWHQVGFTFDGQTKVAYIDGVAVGAYPVSSGTLNSTFSSRRIGVFGSTTGYYANGHISNVKIFNRALSPEEIAIEYKRTGPTKMTQHNGTTFIQGQFKEVII